MTANLYRLGVIALLIPIINHSLLNSTIITNVFRCTPHFHTKTTPLQITNTMQFLTVLSLLAATAVAGPLHKVRQAGDSSGTCGGVPYSSGTWTCFENKVLCPIQNGKQFQHCNSQCYDPSIWRYVEKSFNSPPNTHDPVPIELRAVPAGRICWVKPVS